jgi:enoyl-CoA hydratase/carnithine racemase
MMNAVVSFETRGPVAWATLNRPEALNALSGDVMQGLMESVLVSAADPEIRVLVWTGTGRAFSVGGDIKEMAAVDEPGFRRAQRRYQALSRVCRDLEKPILAAINGYALGGGLELALMCDLRIAAESAQLGLPDAVLGFSPGGGMTFLLPRAIGMGRTMHMALLTEPLSAREALDFGLVTHVVPDEQLLESVQEMAERMAGFPERGLAYMKQAFYSAAENSFANTLVMEEEIDLACFRSEETQAALKAFLESRRKRKERRDG